VAAVPADERDVFGDGRCESLYTLLGSTMANLDNKVRFFNELAGCAALRQAISARSTSKSPPRPPSVQSKSSRGIRR